MSFTRRQSVKQHFSVPRFGFGGSHGFSGKTIFVIFVYMSLVYTCATVFALASSDYYGVAPEGMAIYVDGWVYADEYGNVNSKSDIGDVDGGWNLNKMGEDVSHLNYSSSKDAGETEIDDDLIVQFWKWLTSPVAVVVDTLGGWGESIWAFFGVIWSGFGMAMSLLTFGLTSPVAFPWFLSWIPFMMVLPVWLCIIYAMIPVATATINAIGNLIPFT